MPGRGLSHVTWPSRATISVGGFNVPSKPGAPGNVGALAVDSAASVFWDYPNDNLSPITDYIVLPYIGATPQAPIDTGGTATSFLVTGLTNGVTYTFSVMAVNALGQSSWSAISNPVTPGVSVTWWDPSTMFGSCSYGGGERASGVPPPPRIPPQLNLTSLATDNFQRANASTLGTGWSALPNGSLTIASNVCQSFYNGGFIGNFRNTETYDADQYSKITCGPISSSGSDSIGPITRYQTSNGAYYTALINGSVTPWGTVALWYYNGSGFTQVSDQPLLTAATSCLGGSTPVVELVSEGNHHTILINGVSVTAVYDGTITGGVPGLIAIGNPPTATAWEGGNAHTGAVGAALQTDNFNRADGGVSVGQSGWQILTGWAAGAGDPAIVSNQIVITGSAGHKGVGRTEVYNNDQWSQIAIGSAQLVYGQQGYMGPMTRLSSNGSNGYIATLNITSSGTGYAYALYRIDSGTNIQLISIDAANHAGTAPDPAATPAMLVSVGSRHSLRVGGSEIFAVTDATYASGVPGFGLYQPSSGTITADNFACGNV